MIDFARGFLPPAWFATGMAAAQWSAWYFDAVPSVRSIASSAAFAVVYFSIVASGRSRSQQGEKG